MTGGEKCDIVMQLTVKQAQNKQCDRCLTV
nr:MAG TPA: hypothetical protein [Caudoviricetes sp.]